jgi:hypothetical protein
LAEAGELLVVLAVVIVVVVVVVVVVAVVVAVVIVAVLARGALDLLAKRLRAGLKTRLVGAV